MVPASSSLSAPTPLSKLWGKFPSSWDQLIHKNALHGELLPARVEAPKFTLSIYIKILKFSDFVLFFSLLIEMQFGGDVVL